MKIGCFKGTFKNGTFKPGYLSWLAVSFMALACCLLAVLQYRWITDFSVAQRDRLHEQLQGRLDLLARSFNEEISAAGSALVPPGHFNDGATTISAYGARYDSWKQTHRPLFRRISLVAPEHGDLALWNLDLQTSEFQRADWPAEWKSERAHLLARMNHVTAEPFDRQSPALLELSRFGAARDREPPRPEDDWLLAELNLDYIRDTFLPELLNRYVGDGGKLNYDAEVISSADPSAVIYQSAYRSPYKGAVAKPPRIASAADASVTLLDIQPLVIQPRVPSFRDGSFGDQPLGEPHGRGGPPGFGRRGSFGPPGPPGPPPELRNARGPSPPNQLVPASFGPGRWRLLVRHHAGSLEALVDQARNRNIVVSAGLLLLILATIAALVRVSRQSQRLAQAQMNFVAGVSHELRTPLTVIRTAAFNLRGKRTGRPDQVEEYGKLIQRESEKLTGLVEQVLRFASGEAGHVIREREPVPVETIIDLSVDSIRESLESRGVELEMHVEPGLPLVLADRQAMQHALGNIIENALKYGTEGHRWVGVSAEVLAASDGPAVEIRVADRGPGIPAEERDHIFDPFFRGRRAVADQLHGTGLGLSLVKKIVEAHGGTISVHSEPNRRTEFILRIPTAPPELQHEFAHSLG